MSSTINADTTNGVVITSDTSGEIKLQSAGTDIATVDSSGITMASGKVLAPTGPAFSAYLSADQAISSIVNTKVQLDTELFDTNNCFDTTNYRFTPNVAGYYQFNATVRSNTSSQTQFVIMLWKNGSIANTGVQSRDATSSTNQFTMSDLIYMNGTTDYIELYALINGTSPVLDYLGDSSTARLSGFLARAV